MRLKNMGNGVTNKQDMCPWYGFFVGRCYGDIVVHDYTGKPIQGGVIPVESGLRDSDVPLKALVDIKKGEIRTRVTRLGYRLPE
jgi:hypothetical protein